jgi:hypothetical protein
MHYLWIIISIPVNDMPISALLRVDPDAAWHVHQSIGLFSIVNLSRRGVSSRRFLEWILESFLALLLLWVVFRLCRAGTGQIARFFRIDILLVKRSVSFLRILEKLAAGSQPNELASYGVAEEVGGWHLVAAQELQVIFN